jgi:alpha-D-ribose 1-methylphosphonate 5-triphosphate synthase subunit PhnG
MLKRSDISTFRDVLERPRAKANVVVVRASENGLDAVRLRARKVGTDVGIAKVSSLKSVMKSLS